MGRHALRLLVWAPPLFGLWFLLTADWTRVEAVTAAAVAIVAAASLEVAVTRARIPVRVSAAGLRAATTVPVAIVVDFAILSALLVRALARRERVHGTFCVRELPPGARGRRGAARRAWMTILATYSPNAYVIDADGEDGLALLHELVPRRSSEQPM